tara:strand:+ start:203 stop:1261 length:1059 start_codon:yes stop_codon:yes gene_type:complete
MPQFATLLPFALFGHLLKIFIKEYILINTINILKDTLTIHNIIMNTTLTPEDPDFVRLYALEKHKHYFRDHLKYLIRINAIKEKLKTLTYRETDIDYEIGIAIFNLYIEKELIIPYEDYEFTYADMITTETEKNEFTDDYILIYLTILNPDYSKKLTIEIRFTNEEFTKQIGIEKLEDVLCYIEPEYLKKHFYTNTGDNITPLWEDYEEKGENNNDCPCCLEPFSEKVEKYVPSCGHPICKGCIVVLFDKNILCPICRNDYSKMDYMLDENSEYINDIIECKKAEEDNEYLKENINMETLLAEMFQVDGVAHTLGIENYVYDDLHIDLIPDFANQNKDFDMALIDMVSWEDL